MPGRRDRLVQIGAAADRTAKDSAENDRMVEPDHRVDGRSIEHQRLRRGKPAIWRNPDSTSVTSSVSETSIIDPVA